MLSIRAADILVAFALLTRWPVPIDHAQAGSRVGHAIWAYPIVGFSVAAVACGVGWLARSLGVPDGVVAGLMLAVALISTGALHEDGLADSVDGLWGGATRERRLEIMRDSRVGSYGVLALILSVGLRWMALFSPTMLPAYLVAAAISRAAMGLLFAWVVPARVDGLAALPDRPPTMSAVLGFILALVLSLAFLGWSGALAASIALVATAMVAWIAIRLIGGHTGDILGAAQQVSEVMVLIALSAVLI